MGKKCSEPGCKRYALFGHKFLRVPEFCRNHKQDEMVNVVQQLCVEKDCETRPVITGGTPIYLCSVRNINTIP
jgi:hypothetical protein